MKSLMQTYLSFLASAVALILPTHAAAQWSTTASLGGRFVTMTEYTQSGERFVKEQGWLPGLETAIAYRAVLWQLYGSAQFYRDDLHYDGQLQNGRPFDSESDTAMTQVQIGAAYHFASGYAVSAAVEYDRWSRDIKGGSGVVGLQEKTSSRRLLLGVERSVRLSTIGDIETKLAIVMTEPERTKVGFSGILDSTSLKTKSATGYRLGFVVRPDYIDNMEIGLELDRIRVGRSGPQNVTRNGSFAGTITQPEHTRKHATVTVGFRF